MWQYIITFTASLLVALITVWISLRWSARERDKRVLRGLKNELATNVTICKYLCENLDKETEWVKDGKHGITPLAQLQTWAWNIAKSTIILSDHDGSSKLEYAYIAADIINRYIQRIEELKYGAVTSAKNIKEMRENNCVALKNYILEAAIPALTEARNIIDKELSKDKWWRF